MAFPRRASRRISNPGGIPSVTGCDFAFNDRRCVNIRARITVRRRLIGSRASERFHQVSSLQVHIGATRSGADMGPERAYVHTTSLLFSFPSDERNTFLLLSHPPHPRACHLSRDGDAPATRSTFSSCIALDSFPLTLHRSSGRIECSLTQSR